MISCTGNFFSHHTSQRSADEIKIHTANHKVVLFHFTFTNKPWTSFDVLVTTNPALPMSNWTILGPATEGPPGHFQFTDTQAAGITPRFYRTCSP